nr:HAMP domain-containing histidine kinase [Prevotella sp.]
MNILKNKSLLNKSLSQFVICTVIILLLSAPLFYLLTKYYYAEDVEKVVHAYASGSGIPPLDLEEDIMAGLTLQILLMFAILCISLLITMRFVTNRLWRPFEDTLQKIERFDIEQGQIPSFAKTDIIEFVRLNEAISHLMKRDHSHFKEQKEFTENASHELQTPIAVTRTQLDLLLQEPLTERQSEIVSNLYNVNTRMSRLNKNLLLLSRIESSQYINTEDISLCDFVEQRLPMYSMLQSCPSIDFIKPETKIMIKANNTLLESLVNNLVINAIRHNLNNEPITLRITSSTLSVSNLSTGKQLNKETIFRRFQFSDDRKRGNGLGLAIVKAICDYHGWTVVYDYRNGSHCFTVTFNTL